MAEDTTVVIGGGIIGLACAYELALAGRRVHVVDRAPIGSGASSGNAGWVTLSQAVPVPSPGSVRDALRSAGRPDSPLYVRPVSFGLPGALAVAVPALLPPAGLRSRVRRCSAPSRSRSFEVYDEWEKNGVETSRSSPGLLHAFLDEREALRSLHMAADVAEGRYAVPDAPLGSSRGPAARARPGRGSARGVPDRGRGTGRPERRWWRRCVSRWSRSAARSRTGRT